MATPLVLSTGTVLSITGAAYVTAMLVNLTKFLLDFIVSPTGPYHSPAVRLYAFMVATAIVFCVDFLTYHLSTRADVLNAFSASVSVFGAAVLVYHVISADSTPTPTPPPALVLPEPPPTP